MRSVTFIIRFVVFTAGLGQVAHGQWAEWSTCENNDGQSYCLAPVAHGRHVAKNQVVYIEGRFVPLAQGAAAPVTERTSSLSVPLGAQPVLYSVSSDANANFPRTLMTIDPTDGSQTQAGPAGATFDPLAMDADPVSGLLFGVDWWDNGGPNTSVIYEIDPSTGFSRSIARITEDGSTFQMLSLTFSPDGVLYASRGANWPQRGFKIGRVDLLAGTFDPVLEVITANPIFVSMDFSPAGVLYADATEQFPDSSQVQTLVIIDLESGAVARIGRVEPFTVGDIDYAADGVIYCSNYSWALVRIDPSDARATLVGFGDVGGFTAIASFSSTPCLKMDSDSDDDIDLKDYAAWQNCVSGPN